MQIEEILNILMLQIFTLPEVIIALVAAVGLIAQKAKAERVIIGALKTMAGIMVLKVGTGQLVATFGPALGIFNQWTGLTGVVLDSYPGLSAMFDALERGNIYGLFGYVMAVGFIFSLLIARFTRFKVVHLAGHIMMFNAILSTWLLYFYFGLTGWTNIVLASLFMALYWTVYPYAFWKRTYPKVTGKETNITLGHVTGANAYFIGTFVAKFFGREEDSAEKLKLPGILAIFGDNVVNTSVVMGAFFITMALLAGPDLVQPVAGTQHWLIWTMLLGVKFAVGLVVILTGVRMFLAELMPAFKGWADTIIPGVIPAFDVPVYYPMAPQATLLGFLANFVGEIVAMVVMIVLGFPVIGIPGAVPTYFGGAIEGVVGNAYGGWKGAIATGFLGGLVVIWGGTLMWQVSGLYQAAFPAQSDHEWLWMPIVFIFKLITGK